MNEFEEITQRVSNAGVIIKIFGH